MAKPLLVDLPVETGSSGSSLTPRRALRLAWMIWMALLVIPYVVVLFALRKSLVAPAAQGDPRTAAAWFTGIMSYLLVAIPIAVLWRSHLFSAYWRGEPVSPPAYLRGMVTLWATLAVGGTAALIVCVVTATLMPNIVPSAVSFFLYILHWPVGSAMTNHAGASDDPQLYQEPR